MAGSGRLRWVSSDEHVPWAEAVEEFCAEKQDAGLASGSVGQYLHVLHPFPRCMRDALGHECFERLDEAGARAVLRHIETHGLSGLKPVGAKRWNEILGHLRRFFEWRVKRGYAAHNPFAKIKRKKVPERLPPELTLEQIERLLAVIPTNTFPRLRNRLILLFLYETGCRISEALSVQDNEELTRGVVTVIGKGNKQREVGLCGDFMRELRPYRRKREAALQETDQPDSPWLFPTERGGRLATRTFQEDLKKHGERAGIEGVRVSPHTVRHSRACDYMRQGGDSLRLMYMLGHSTLTMTNRYAARAARDVKDEMRKSSPLARLSVPPVRGRRMRRAPAAEGSAPDRG